MSNTISDISLLVNDVHVQRWVFRSLEYLLSERDANIETIIVRQSEKASTLDKCKSVLDNGAWGVYRGCSSLYTKIFGNEPEFRQSRSLREIIDFNDTEVMYCAPIEDGAWNELPNEAVQLISETDLALRFGFGLLKGAALDAPTHGVLSYHHGDLREYRGPPTGFWEFMDDKSEAGITIQRLDDSIDAGEIVELKVIDISQANSWQEIKRQLFTESTTMLPNALNSVESADTQVPPNLGEYKGFPEGKSFIYFIYRNYW